MSILSFEIISVPVADQEKSKRFYHEVLGFDVVRDEAMSPEARWIQLSPKGCATTIALVNWFETMRPGGLQGVMLNVDDIDAEHARLAKQGLALTDIKQEPWGRFTMLSDPDGNGWILRQPPNS
jgi:catechol 2,3-dioxygenase-like lactoylglutathione lyase family enzyme